jgi:hypothetical protein
LEAAVWGLGAAADDWRRGLRAAPAGGPEATADVLLPKACEGGLTAEESSLLQVPKTRCASINICTAPRLVESSCGWRGSLSAAGSEAEARSPGLQGAAAEMFAADADQV